MKNDYEERANQLPRRKLICSNCLRSYFWWQAFKLGGLLLTGNTQTQSLQPANHSFPVTWHTPIHRSFRLLLPSKKLENFSPPCFFYFLQSAESFLLSFFSFFFFLLSSFNSTSGEIKIRIVRSHSVWSNYLLIVKTTPICTWYAHTKTYTHTPTHVCVYVCVYACVRACWGGCIMVMLRISLYVILLNIQCTEHCEDFTMQRRIWRFYFSL